MSSSIIHLSTTSDIYLAKCCNALKIPMGPRPVVMRDECYLPETGKGLIVNLESSDENGTHWICFYRSALGIFYEDSFGVPPIQELVDLCRKERIKLFFNTLQHQALSSDDCGYQCLFFLDSMVHNKGMVTERFANFHRQFRGKVSNGEMILHKWALKHRKQLGK